MDISYRLLNEINQKYGDSWYLLDLDKFDQNYNDLLSAFKNIYPRTQIAYSYKTNYIPVICQRVDKQGGYAEVVSNMEYDLAIKVGVHPSKIVVNGPYKPADALEKYLTNGSLVNLDSYNEVEILKTVVANYPDTQLYIGLRCNFDTNSITFSRFGFDISEGSFVELIKELKHYKNIRKFGLSYHFPNRDILSHKERIDKMIHIVRKLFPQEPPDFIDVGGGLGGKINDYIKKQLNYEISEYTDYANVIAAKLKKEYGMKENAPMLILEPGTAIVADTMKFICKVIEIKKIRGKFIAIVSGSKVNFHPLASQIDLPLKVYANNAKLDRRYFDDIDISGYTCMENDYLYRNFQGQLDIGDFLAFENVGSYSIVFKPPFILPNVPVLTANNQKIQVVKEKETFDNIFQTFSRGFNND